MLVGLAIPAVPAALAWVALHHPSPAAWTGLTLAAAGSAAALGIQIGTARHFRAPWAYGLLFPLGYAVAAAIALNAVRLARAGRVTWKGRTYSPAG